MKKGRISQVNIIALILGIILITVISQITIANWKRDHDRCQSELSHEVENHRYCSLGLEDTLFKLDACNILVGDWQEFTDRCWYAFENFCKGGYPE